MVDQEQKLTAGEASRYDRRMSEAGAAVLEKEAEEMGLDVFDPQIVAQWKPYMENATSVVRDFIFDKIKEKEPPADGIDEKRLEELAKEKVDKKFKEMTDPSRLEIRKVEDLYKVDVILDNYMKHTDRAQKELGDDSVAKGDLLKEQESWSEYGWSDPEKERVKAELTEALEGLNTGKDKEKQIDTIMEMLLAKGIKPSDLTDLRTKREEAQDYFVGAEMDPRYRSEYYKDNPDIFFVHTLARKNFKVGMEDPTLGITHDEIKRLIFGKIYLGTNDYELYYAGRPRNIETLAWQIMQTSDEGYNGWGIKGDNPLLEMRIVKKADGSGVDTEKSGYRVNTANMVQWARSLMWKQYDRDREDPHDYFSVISLQGRAALSFNEMLLSPKQFFASEDGTDYKGLMLEWYKEAAVFTTVRAWDVGYRLAQESPDELKKLFKQMYDAKNLMTRNALGANIMGLMTTMPLDFKGQTEGKWESDSTMGAAWIDMYRCYDSINDYENLRKILGEGSQFFNIKGWAQAFMEIAGENKGVTGVREMRVFMKKQGYEEFEKAFDEDTGEVVTAENRKYFVKFLNIFGERLIGGKHEWTVRAALRGAIAEKYGKEVYVKDSEGDILEEVMTREVYDKVRKYSKCEEVKDPDNPVPEGKVRVRYKKFAFVSESGKIGDDIDDRVENTTSLLFAEAMAWSMVKPLGAGAKNDPDAVGHDWMGRPYHTELFRAKYTYKGDKQGNKLTTPIFKSTVVDILNAIATEAYTPVLDEHGRKTYKSEEDKKKDKPIMRSKTPMEVMAELSELRTISAKAIKEKERELEAIPKENQAEREAKIREIKEFSSEANQIYQDRAQDMSFTQQTLTQYRLDHLEYGMDMYKYLVDNEEIEWEKFTDYNIYGGVRFKQEEFAKVVQSELIHKVRYMFENFGSLNYNQIVRVMDQTKTHERHFKKHDPDDHDKHRNVEPVFKDVRLGEAMFGHEMLNRAEFWKRDDKGKPINMVDRKGRKMKGLYEIDYQKVQDNKQALWKQWVMTKIAADLYSHRALHEDDIRFNFTYYQQAIEALGRIPGNLDQDQYKFKDTHVKEFFFNKADIAWIREKSNATNFSLYAGAFFKDVLLEDDKSDEGIGILLALSLAMKAIVRDKV